MLFSLAQDMALLVPTARNFAERKLIPLSWHQQHIMRIWLSPAPQFHYALEKLWWKLEEHLDSISAIALDPLAGKVYTVSDNTSLQKFTAKGLEHIIVPKKDRESMASFYMVYEAG